MPSLFKNCFGNVRPKIILITSLVLVTTSQSFAQENPKNAISKQVTAVRTDSDTIWLNGRLDESIWTTAPTMSNFIQKEPVEGAPPTDLMTVKFLYDDDALYVGAHMHAQSREWIQAPLGRRDDVRLGEYIMISLDTFLDRRTAYTFGVTASGVRLDHFHPEDREWHPDPELEQSSPTRAGPQRCGSHFHNFVSIINLLRSGELTSNVGFHPETRKFIGS